MLNFQDTFETCKPSFFSVFSICMTVPLSSAYKIRIFSSEIRPLASFDLTFLSHEMRDAFGNLFGQPSKVSLNHVSCRRNPNVIQLRFCDFETDGNMQRITLLQITPAQQFPRVLLMFSEEGRFVEMLSSTSNHIQD